MNQTGWVAQQLVHDRAVDRLSEAAAWRLAAEAQRDHGERNQPFRLLLVTSGLLRKSARPALPR